MAYVDNLQNRNRTGPVAAVIAIHAGIGYLLVTGLGATIIERIVQPNPIGIDIPLDPPPVDDPPPPDTTPEPAVDQKVQAPVPPLEFAKPTKFEVEPAKLPPIGDIILDPGPIVERPVEPTLAFDPVAARPRNNPAEWVTANDYPTGPLRRGQEGITAFRLDIGANGKVQNCTITRSSGFEGLDQATCRFVSKRARFNAARDGSDKPVAGTYQSSVRWQIPD